MSRKKAAGRRGRGKRACSKQRSNSRKPAPKAAYRHPLAAAMADLLKGLVPAAADKPRRGHKLLWTPLLLSFCAILMSWDPSPSLAARFEAAGLSLGNLLPSKDKGGTYQGWIKAMVRNGTLHQRLADRLRDSIRQMAQGAGCWLREGWCPFTADSSKFNCPRTQENEKAFGCASKKGKCPGIPQQLLTVLWHMGSGLPWAWEAGVAKASEREQLLSMLGLLPIQALLVADAGFVGYELLKAIAASDRHFLIRVGANVSLIGKLGFFQEKDDTVYLWPTYDSRHGTWRQRKAPLVLRLIRIQEPGKKTVYLLSNVLEQPRLSQRVAHVFYRLRWGVEVFFRSLKQTLDRRKLASAAPAQAKLELQWAVMGITVLGYLSVSAVVAAGKDPLSYSVALALAVLRRCARCSASAAGDLAAQLAMALKDSYIRTAPKRSRNWPRRKRCKPPGRPRLRRATKAEVKMAQELHRNSVVNQFTA
jgi:hypothetical protein